MKNGFSYHAKLKNLFLTVFFSLLIWGMPVLVSAQTPTPTGSPTPDPIPTLNEWGYGITGVLLALITIWFILRRQQDA